jgi:hypothetical protein
MRGTVLADSKYIHSGTCENKVFSLVNMEVTFFLDVTPCGFVGK